MQTYFLLTGAMSTSLTSGQPNHYWTAYISVNTTPVTYANMVNNQSIGVRNATETPFRHWGSYQLCSPSSTQECCVLADAGSRYDYWCVWLGVMLLMNFASLSADCRHGCILCPQKQRMRWWAGVSMDSMHPSGAAGTGVHWDHAVLAEVA